MDRINMTIIKNTDDLLNIAAAQAPNTACGRYIQKYPEDVRFYGQFGATEDTSHDLWVVSVFSPISNKEWILGIRATTEIGRYEVCRIQKLENIPWGTWRGKQEGGNLLVDGSIPEECHRARLASIKLHRQYLPDGLTFESLMIR
jgi:hypothetical protein